MLQLREKWFEKSCGSFVALLDFQRHLTEKSNHQTSTVNKLLEDNIDNCSIVYSTSISKYWLKFFLSFYWNWNFSLNYQVDENRCVMNSVHAFRYHRTFKFLIGTRLPVHANNKGLNETKVKNHKLGEYNSYKYGSYLVIFLKILILNNNVKVS